MGEETTYQYDGVGNLVEKLDAKNQKTDYEYDDAGRLEEIRYYDPVDLVNPVKVGKKYGGQVFILDKFSAFSICSIFVFSFLSLPILLEIRLLECRGGRVQKLLGIRSSAMRPFRHATSGKIRCP